MGWLILGCARNAIGEVSGIIKLLPQTPTPPWDPPEPSVWCSASYPGASSERRERTCTLLSHARPAASTT
eukprot:572210-Prymnesium_polylepis.1